MLSTTVATLAPIISGVQLLPQLYKTYQTKSAKDLSLNSLLLIFLTNILWLFNGYFTINYSLIISGIINLVVSILLLSLFVQYR